MIFVNLCGGLGNQLIQLALAKRLLELKGDKVCVCSIDKDMWNVSEGVKLACLNLGVRYASRPVSRLSRRLRRLLCTIFPSLGFIQKYRDIREILDKASIHRHIVVDGYWQTAANVVDLYHTDLTVIEQSIRLTHSTNERYCLLHIRLGDYQGILNRFIFRRLPICYYVRALKIVTKIISHPKILVCSNGPKENIEKYIGLMAKLSSIDRSDFLLCDGNEREIFTYMLDADIIIGSNSTFSFMGYLLTKKSKKLGIFPANWFVAGRHPLSNLGRTVQNLKIQ